MQPNVSAPPPQPADSSDKLLAILCHLSFLIGLGFILPLVVYLVKRNESAFVRSHSSEVLNFHLSIIIYLICAFVLIFVLIGIPLLILIALFAFICAIIGAVKASNVDEDRFWDFHDLQNGTNETHVRIDCGIYL